MKTLFTLVFAASIVFSGSVLAAGTPVESTKTCLTDNTSGKDRKLLAKWVFLSMASHPEFKSLSSASAQDQEDTSRAFAALVTRLMTVDCKDQMQAMIAADPDVSVGMKIAFSHLGEVAMLELMAHEDVNASISQFGKFIDEDKLASALGKKAGVAN